LPAVDIFKPQIGELMGIGTNGMAGSSKPIPTK
jgi:hypothetical protein